MLPFRDGRARRALILGLLLANGVAWSAWAQQAKPKKKKAPVQGTATPEPNAQVPLPIGHEAKGLVLPDIDANGHVRGRFVAGTARRQDQDHMEFKDLNITSFNDQNEVELQVVMAQGVLDMNTRVLTSPTLTKVKRSDFEIVGDRARFDTVARQGTLTGKVHMTITNAQKYSAPESK